MRIFVYIEQVVNRFISLNKIVVYEQFDVHFIAENAKAVPFSWSPGFKKLKMIKHGKSMYLPKCIFIFIFKFCLEETVLFFSCY